MNNTELSVPRKKHMKNTLFCLLIFLFGNHALFGQFQDIHDFQKRIIKQERTGSNVAMVFRDGKTLYHNICNSGKPGDMDIDENTIFPIWSMSKPVTIVAMMTLYEKGLVQWDDPVSKYIPYFANLRVKKNGHMEPAKNELRVLHLMTHRSGYQYYGNPFLLKAGGGLAGATYEEPQPNQIKYNNLDDFVKDVASQPLEFEPGTQYLYGINQAILGRIIEVITGQSYYGYLKQALFDPLEMRNTKFYLTEEDRKHFQVLFINADNLKGFTHLLDSFMTYRKENQAHFGGEGLVSTLGDYAKFCQMLLNRGVYKSRQIIGEESLKQMTRRWSEPNSSEKNDETGLKGFYYGFSLFVLDKPELDGVNASKGIFGWSGYHNTHFWIDPQKNLFGLFMTRAREYSWDIQKEFRKAVYSSVD